MSSIRVSSGLLAELHRAAPPGIPLPQLLRTLLHEAGGAEAVRVRLQRQDRHASAAARVRRLKIKRHRSVLLSDSEQISLAQSCADWVNLLETSGERRYDPERRTIALRARPPRTAGKLRMERTGWREKE